MGIMAIQCPVAHGYHVTETTLLEVVDSAGRPCGPGEVGRILVTDLLNYSSPLIRYEIGDYAEVGSPCPCGRGLSTIRRFLGRERNLVLLPDGTRYWATVKFSNWKQIYPVRQFQFTQLDRQVIEARFVASGRPTAVQEAALVEQIRSGLGYPFEIRVFWQETPLSVGPGGKFEEFLCRAT
jgi:phenylacetate-CoA ligase